MGCFFCPPAQKKLKAKKLKNSKTLENTQTPSQTSNLWLNLTKNVKKLTSNTSKLVFSQIFPLSIRVLPKNSIHIFENPRMSRKFEKNNKFETGQYPESGQKNGEIGYDY